MLEQMNVACPNCDHQKLISIDELRRNTAFICIKCGTQVTIDTGKFFAELNGRSPVHPNQKEIDKPYSL